MAHHYIPYTASLYTVTDIITFRSYKLRSYIGAVEKTRSEPFSTALVLGPRHVGIRHQNISKLVTLKLNLKIHGQTSDEHTDS